MSLGGSGLGSANASWTLVFDCVRHFISLLRIVSCAGVSPEVIFNLISLLTVVSLGGTNWIELRNGDVVKGDISSAERFVEVPMLVKDDMIARSESLKVWYEDHMTIAFVVWSTVVGW